MSLLPLDQGLARIRASVAAVSDTEICDVSDAARRVLAHDVYAGAPVPPIAKSAMDGYAVFADDVPGTLRVSQQVFAGYAAEPLVPGTCARIYTGSVLPYGADTVIMQEDVERDGDDVTFPATADRGNNVRVAGCDIAQGDLLVRAGRVLTAADIALLSLIGLPTVEVKRRLVIGVFSTGDELVSSGSELVSDWQLVDSNRPQI
ncbi:MAG: molybdopterin molybdenumtransferase MoeA, partial [Luminiphilus sp.]|nr:molybdopterin molybdenumtransferase MoeA [Luminiphilus sp.]